MSCLDWHCINLAHMTQESMVSQSPSWGVNVLASLSLWMWSQWYANSYCGFQGPCCVSAMIWSKIVFLLTLTLLPSITNVEPKRDYEHCHEILYCTWLLLQMLMILPSHSHFWIEKISITVWIILKQFHPYIRAVSYKFLVHQQLPTTRYITPDNFWVLYLMSLTLINFKEKIHVW